MNKINSLKVILAFVIVAVFGLVAFQEVNPYLEVNPVPNSPAIVHCLNNTSDIKQLVADVFVVVPRPNEKKVENLTWVNIILNFDKAILLKGKNTKELLTKTQKVFMNKAKTHKYFSAHYKFSNNISIIEAYTYDKKECN